ncbi:MAG TPA: signal peptidase I, partial [Cryomorphaceae bacterium]|nr:signal peptidase I [Cryomorphaceae bacterium]
WMMGDNRHNSWDSRYWGFVPEDHIVGKPVFIFFSSDQFIEGFLSSKRWERFFTVVHGEGQPTSYLWPFVILVALYYGWDYYRKRKAAQ